MSEPVKMTRLTGTWITRCCVCGKTYINGCGSTQCCGAVQEVVASVPGDNELSELRAKLSTETRWPNVQAVLMDEDEQLEVLINDDRFFVQTIYSADDAGEGKTLELALDSLEQKIAERKEGK